MSLVLKRWCDDAKRSIGALWKLFFYRPAYLVLALLIGLAFYQIVFWFLNLGLAHYLFTNSYLSVADKLSLVWGSLIGAFQPPISGLGITLVLVALFQGLAISGLIYSWRHNRQQQNGASRALGGTGIAGLLSVLGLGCAACGTSLVTPLLALFVGSASVSLADQIGFYAALLAFALTLVSLYVIGRRLAINLALDRERDTA